MSSYSIALVISLISGEMAGGTAQDNERFARHVVMFKNAHHEYNAFSPTYDEIYSQMGGNVPTDIAYEHFKLKSAVDHYRSYLLQERQLRRNWWQFHRDCDES